MTFWFTNHALLTHGLLFQFMASTLTTIIYARKHSKVLRRRLGLQRRILPIKTAKLLLRNVLNSQRNY
jgi:hypothetical protein